MIIPSRDECLLRALVSLEGLSIGDAFGEQFFVDGRNEEDLIARRVLPPGPWYFTDDTQMALSIHSVLRQYGHIKQEMLAFGFASRYDPSRGYGPAMHWLLNALSGQSQAWSPLARSLFGGQGSFGNGAAMRVAPLGAYFANNLDAVVEQAQRSAEVTHAHPEGVAGAIGTAVAAAVAWRLHDEVKPSRSEFIEMVLPYIPDGVVREKARHARDLAPGCSVRLAVAALGNGSEVSAQDTVPFVLWCAGERLDNYEEAMWLTVSGLGDRDTTCAMVGGIVALSAGADSIPATWRQGREPLPRWPFQERNEL